MPGRLKGTENKLISPARTKRGVRNHGLEGNCSPSEAQGRLQNLYAGAQIPDGYVDISFSAPSLRPRTLRAHLELYKAALHSKPSGLS